MKIKALYCSFLLSGCLAFAPVAAEEGADSVIVQQAKKEKKERTELLPKAEEKKGLVLGGYGEAVTSRYFYSDQYTRYIEPEKFKNCKSRGEFDLPHVTFMIGYNFGKGWRMNAELEYEHGGTGSAMEIENNEGGEIETELEQGGEVELEQNRCRSSRVCCRRGPWHPIKPRSTRAG